MQVVSCYLPVKESFGLDAELKEVSSGRALPQCSFSHWKTIQSDPLDPELCAGKIALELRGRKGLGSIPDLS